jgi:alanine-alpha-ketoisovalerate/valine-pyruvate aminotransferase
VLAEGRRTEEPKEAAAGEPSIIPSVADLRSDDAAQAVADADAGATIVNVSSTFGHRRLPALVTTVGRRLR